MKNLILVALCLAPLSAQDPQAQDPPAQTPAAETQPAQTPSAQTPAAPPAAAQPAAAHAPAAQSTVPSPNPPPGEEILTGWIDLGYRWLIGPGGNGITYRSIVDLGSGPKMLETDFTIRNPSHKYVDVVHVRAANWADPYQTLHVDASKSGLYQFNADYRDFAYFNALPTYADPLLSRGIMLNEQAYDVWRKVGTFELDLWPAKTIVPYLVYDFNSTTGNGVSTFVSFGNQYPLPEQTENFTNVFRAGVRIGRGRYHATVETGGTLFKENDNLFQGGGTNYGNSNTPYLGQTLYLSTFASATGVRGSSYFQRGDVTLSPADWIDISGQILYSEPHTDTNYFYNATGLFASQIPYMFYTSQQFILASTANMPHTVGGATVELHRFRRIRIIESVMTDRLHNAGSTNEASFARLYNNYNQTETDLIVDAGSHITVRGGYRYVWGDGFNVVLPQSGLVGADYGTLSRNVGIAAVTYRPGTKFSVTAEGEVARSGGAYFNTSLYNYERARFQTNYQLRPDLVITGNFWIFNNNNPLNQLTYYWRSTQAAASVFWTPANKKWDALVMYSYGDLTSNIGYLIPQTLEPAVWRYRELGNIETALINYNGLKALTITAGGSFTHVSGSRPTAYYQPLAKVLIPVNKMVKLFAEWQYWGYGEPFYLFEGFRAQAVTAGVRLSR